MSATKITRKILAQGDLDGACYLYSIANSYFALTAKMITPAKWKASIRALPFKLDDFLSGQGTEALDSTPHYFEGLCQDFLDKIRKNQFQITRRESISHKSLRASLTDNQVAIAAINEGAHWVSIVDADKGQFYLACSAAALSSEAVYFEGNSPNFQRPYNKKSAFADLKIWNDYALLVRNANDE